MAGHWRFLELSLPTPDIAASLEFYTRLGFSEISTTDARAYPYVVVTDGRIAIGLHANDAPGPALSFVQPNVANWARQLEAAGFEIEQQRLGLDDFHEFTLVGPSDHRVTVVEAATFSAPQIQSAPAPLTGPSSHIALECADLDEAAEFWRIAGLEADTEDLAAEAERELELAAPAVRVRLLRSAGRLPRLSFVAAALPELQAAAERYGLPLRPRGPVVQATAPEGTLLEIRSG